MILLGVTHGDTEKDAEVLAKKIASHRIFTDENDKLNLSLVDIGGEALVISNFTLYANYRKGYRPDFLDSAKPDRAMKLYIYFVNVLKEFVKNVECGAFGEHMKIDAELDGPITIVMDSEILIKKSE